MEEKPKRLRQPIFSKPRSRTQNVLIVLLILPAVGLFFFATIQGLLAVVFPEGATRGEMLLDSAVLAGIGAALIAVAAIIAR